MDSKFEFPWNFLADPSEPEQDSAVNWIFFHLRGKTYKGYLDMGRGFLVGPFLSDECDTTISTEEAFRKHASGESVGLSVLYLPGRAENLAQIVPDESLRAILCEALNKYNPETQCVILLQHGDTAILPCIVGVADDLSSPHTPRAAYYREFLEHSSHTAGRPS